MSTLADTVHGHHDQLIPRVDDLLETARLVGTASCEELRPRVLATRAFLTGTLIPHMEASERAVYPRLEALLSDTGALARCAASTPRSGASSPSSTASAPRTAKGRTTGARRWPCDASCTGCTPSCGSTSTRRR